MILLDFITTIVLREKTEVERAKLLCFYHAKETAEEVFSMAMIADLLEQSGFSRPNTSRLKDKLTKGKDKCFTFLPKDRSKLIFLPVVYQALENELGSFWLDTETVVSDSELIDESKFCDKRNYLDKLIKQINHSYKNNCYDACAVLMRRLFEILLVLAYQHHGIDDQIKDSSGKGYLMLEGIVSNVKGNQTLKLSRIKNEFDTFRKVGNFSAHNITYTAGKKDIDDIKLNYRVMLEELYTKSGLL